jgi:hypothetical protein
LDAIAAKRIVRDGYGANGQNAKATLNGNAAWDIGEDFLNQSANNFRRAAASVPENLLKLFSVHGQVCERRGKDIGIDHRSTGHS